MMDLIISFVADLIGDLLDEVIKLLAPLLGFSFQKFVDTFPYANTAYLIFQRCALVLILLIAGYQLIKWVFPSNPQSRTNPIRIVYNVLLATGFVYFGNYLLEGILRLCIFPYEALMEANSDKIFYDPGNLLSLGSALSDAFKGFTAVLYIIVFCMIGWAFIKLMLESVERYIVLFLLVYASPLAASTLASDATSGIYKKFFTMFLSQCVLMVLNIWVLKLAVSMFQNLGGTSDKMLALLLGWGLLKVGSRLDSYVNQLGLNAAVTGMGLAGEIGMAAGALFGGRGNGGGSGNGLGNGVGSNVLGAAKKFGTTMGKYSPASALGMGAKNMGGALLKTAGQSVGAFNSSFGEGGIVGAAVNRIKNGGRAPSDTDTPSTQPSKGTPGGALNRAGNAAKQTWKKNISGNMDAASMKTQEGNVWARAANGKNRQTAVGNYSGEGGGSPTEVDRGNVADYSHVADSVFRTAVANDAVIDEPENVAAVMQGIGAEKATPAAAEFVDVGYGNLDGVKNVQYSLEQDGIHAAYSKDGATHQMDIVSGETYSSMPKDEQHGYVGFRSDNGQQYYYRHTSHRASRSSGGSGNPGTAPQKPAQKTEVAATPSATPSSGTTKPVPATPASAPQKTSTQSTTTPHKPQKPVQKTSAPDKVSSQTQGTPPLPTKYPGQTPTDPK